MGCCDVYQSDGSLYYCYKGDCMECREVSVQSRHCLRIYSRSLALTSLSGSLQADLGKGLTWFTLAGIIHT